jgi:hypothetical protein
MASRGGTQFIEVELSFYPRLPGSSPGLGIRHARMHGAFAWGASSCPCRAIFGRRGWRFRCVVEEESVSEAKTCNKSNFPARYSQARVLSLLGAGFP